jgi:hypothetical protein
MKALSRLSLAILLFCLFAPEAVAQSHNSEWDEGRFEGSIYQNDYFGFQLNIPLGWQVEGLAHREKSMEQGRKLIASDSREEQARRDASVSRTKQLLNLSLYQDEGRQNLRAVFVCGAEELVSPEVSDVQYAASAKNILLTMKNPVSIEKDMYKESVDGIDFTVFETLSGDQRVRQKYYVHVMRGYALFFISTYANQEDLATMQALIRSVKFNQNGSSRRSQ